MAEAIAGAAAPRAAPAALGASSRRPCTPRVRGNHVVGRRASSPSGSEPPRSNHSTTGRVSAPSNMPVNTRADRGADQIARDLFGAAQLAFILQLELAGDRRQRGVQVGDPRHDERFAVGERAALGVRDHELERA